MEVSKIGSFRNSSSSVRVEFLIDTLSEECKPAIREKSEFENEVELVLKAFEKFWTIKILRQKQRETLK